MEPRAYSGTDEDCPKNSACAIGQARVCGRGSTTVHAQYAQNGDREKPVLSLAV